MRAAVTEQLGVPPGQLEPGCVDGDRRWRCPAGLDDGREYRVDEAFRVETSERGGPLRVHTSGLDHTAIAAVDHLLKATRVTVRCTIAGGAAARAPTASPELSSSPR